MNKGMCRRELIATLILLETGGDSPEGPEALGVCSDLEDPEREEMERRETEDKRVPGPAESAHDCANGDGYADGLGS